MKRQPGNWTMRILKNMKRLLIARHVILNTVSTVNSF